MTKPLNYQNQKVLDNISFFSFYLPVSLFFVVSCRLPCFAYIFRNPSFLSTILGAHHMSTIQKRGSIFTVILKPHNTAFQTRTLELKDKVKIRIGRQTSSKTAPTAFNGYFDSKVLSRQHAEIWCDRTKVSSIWFTLVKGTEMTLNTVYRCM